MMGIENVARYPEYDEGEISEAVIDYWMDEAMEES